MWTMTEPSDPAAPAPADPALDHPAAPATPPEPPAERFARLKILWSFAFPHRRTLAIGLVLALATSAMGLATPMVTKWILDSIAISASLSGPVLVLLGLTVIGSLLGLYQWILIGTLAEDIVYEARESMVRRFFRATIPQIAGRPTGELVTRVNSDTVLLREAASSSIISIVNGTVALIGTLVLMAVLDVVLLGTTVAAIVVVGALMGVLMPRIAKAEEKSQSALGRLGGVLESSLRAVRTVKASRAEQRQGDRIMVDAGEARTFSIRSVRTTAVAWTISWGGIQLAIIVILGLGAWRVGEGLLAVSSLIAFLLYAFNIMGPLSELTQSVTALQSGIAAAARIREVQGYELEVSGDVEGGADGEDRADGEPQEAAVPEGEPPIIALRGVSARYTPSGDPAVEEITLEIPRRGHLAIVGPSGAGKTTLFSLVLRFLSPQEGRLELDGRAYETYTYQEVRERLAYVEQETPVVPGSIRDNLLFTNPEATDAEVDDVLARLHLDTMVDSLDEGLDTTLGSTSVSGGQRQRIALARAMLSQPDVLLLDEATAQVDGITEAAIHGCIRDLAAVGTVVTIAHRLSTVVDADSIVVLDGGRVRAQGTHAELLATDELYRDLVAALRIEAGAAAPLAG